MRIRILVEGANLVNLCSYSGPDAQLSRNTYTNRQPIIAELHTSILSITY